MLGFLSFFNENSLESVALAHWYAGGIDMYESSVPTVRAQPKERKRMQSVRIVLRLTSNGGLRVCLQIVSTISVRGSTNAIARKGRPSVSRDNPGQNVADRPIIRPNGG